MADCHAMDPDPIEAILRNLIPVADVNKKSIRPSTAYGGLTSPTLSVSSSDMIAQSTKGRVKVEQLEGGKSSTDNHCKGDSMSSTETNDNIKVDPALESCLGEIGTGLAWLQHVLQTTYTTDPCVIGKEAMTHNTKNQQSPIFRTEISQDGKDILRQLLNSVAIDDEFLSRHSGSAPSWSFLTRSDWPRSDTDQNPESTSEKPSLFLHILKKIATNGDNKDDTTSQQNARTTTPTKATQILKACSPYFENKAISKNIPPELDSNQIIFAALSFLSSTSISGSDLEEEMENQDETPSFMDPHHHFPLMPLLVLPNKKKNKSSDEDHNPNLRMYQIDEDNLPLSSLQDPIMLTKIHNLEASFWVSTAQYSSRIRVIPRMENETQETMLLFTGGKGDADASSSKKGTKKGGNSGGTKRKSEGQTGGSDGKSKKKKASADATPKE